MAKEYYVYQYLRPDGTPYYIGKGNGDRAFNPRSHRNLTPKNQDRISFVLQSLTEDTAYVLERFWIKVLGRKDLNTGILRNMSDGGEGNRGYRFSVEARKKISIVSSRPKSEAHKKALSDSQRGKKFTSEHKAALKTAMSGIIRSEKYRQASSLARLGKKKKPFSEEARKRMSDSAKNRKPREAAYV